MNKKEAGARSMLSTDTDMLLLITSRSKVL